MPLRRLLVVPIAVLLVLAFGCQNAPRVEAPEQEIIFVRIPPKYDPAYTPGENQCRFSIFLFPNAYPPDLAEHCTGVGLANDDSLLYVTLSSEGNILVNGSAMGNIDDPKYFSNYLSKLFDERTKTGVFEPLSTRIVKAVGLRFPNSSKYGDFFKLAKVAKESGADPIVVLLDGHLPFQPLEAEK